MISRRGFFSISVGLFTIRRAYRLRAVAAEQMPHQCTLHSSDPGVADHFAKGGIFEIRNVAGGREVRLFDSLETRWSKHEDGPAPTSISLYRPA